MGHFAFLSKKKKKKLNRVSLVLYNMYITLYEINHKVENGSFRHKNAKSVVG